MPPTLEDEEDPIFWQVAPKRLRRVPITAYPSLSIPQIGPAFLVIQRLNDLVFRMPILIEKQAKQHIALAITSNVVKKCISRNWESAALAEGIICEKVMSATQKSKNETN